jgi:hypothetical protein
MKLCWWKRGQQPRRQKQRIQQNMLTRPPLSDELMEVDDLDVPFFPPPPRTPPPIKRELLLPPSILDPPPPPIKINDIDNRIEHFFDDVPKDELMVIERFNNDPRVYRVAYRGQMKNGKKHGKGISFQQSNRILLRGTTRQHHGREQYVGNWSNDIPIDTEGEALYFYKGGSHVYIGNWKGILGELYNNNFRGGPNGKGKFYYIDDNEPGLLKLAFEGTFESAMPSKGIFYNYHGRKLYEGQTNGLEKHGIGTLYNTKSHDQNKIFEDPESGKPVQNVNWRSGSIVNLWETPRDFEATEQFLEIAYNLNKDDYTNYIFYHMTPEDWYDRMEYN